MVGVNAGPKKQLHATDMACIGGEVQKGVGVAIARVRLHARGKAFAHTGLVAEDERDKQRVLGRLFETRRDWHKRIIHPEQRDRMASRFLCSELKLVTCGEKLRLAGRRHGPRHGCGQFSIHDPPEHGEPSFRDACRIVAQKMVRPSATIRDVAKRHGCFQRFLQSWSPNVRRLDRR
jgi:hypothetical protein